MKLLDNKGKLFGIINIIDLGVILLFLAVIAAGVYKYATKTGGAIIADQTPFTMEIVTKEVLESTLNEVKDKELVMEHPSNIVIGEIVERKVSPAKREVETADGKVVLADVPNRVEVIFTIKGKGIYNENQGLILGGTDRKIGNSLYFKTNKAVLGGTILNIKVGE